MFYPLNKLSYIFVTLNHNEYDIHWDFKSQKSMKSKTFLLTCVYLLTSHLVLSLKNASGSITLESRGLYSALWIQNDMCVIYPV